MTRAATDRPGASSAGTAAQRGTVQATTSRWRRFPLPFTGYVLMLFGFACLGISVAMLASGIEVGIPLAVATVVLYAAGFGCFLLRRHLIRHPAGPDEPRMSVDPMKPAVDRHDVVRYLARYRGAETSS
ncbi:hypothetical protein [Rhodococcus sp. HNM0569]|uniref:hypothetical protein n=1 Tax=Rhodococcus sp. HNM0569 TaxID=2716340 RepID=UPI00146CE163|nr:hypothetical protein [Rhodococcus sp. HNM0569]NLU84259.1 hypothetical protein [Rhodococcus sp. HNM0569]